MTMQKNYFETIDQIHWKLLLMLRTNLDQGQIVCIVSDLIMVSVSNGYFAIETFCAVQLSERRPISQFYHRNKKACSLNDGLLSILSMFTIVREHLLCQLFHKCCCFYAKNSFPYQNRFIVGQLSIWPNLAVYICGSGLWWIPRMVQICSQFWNWILRMHQIGFETALAPS